MPQKDFDLILKVQADLKEANRQLQSLNDNMRVSNKSAREASGGMDALTRSTDKSEKGIRGIRTQLDGMGGTIKSAASNLKVLAGVIGVAFAVHKIADWTRGLVDANEQLFQLVKQSEGLNVSVKFFSGLTQQADDLGIGIQQVAVVMGTLNRQLATAQRGSKTAQGMFAEFGIDPVKIHSTEEAFLAVSDSVEKYGLNAKRAGILTQIFGTSGKDIVPILKQGAAAIRAQNDAMEKTGQIITDSQVPAIVQLHNATDRIGDSFTALRNNLIIQLAPSISQIADQFNDFVTTQGPGFIREITEIVQKLPDLAAGFLHVAEAAIKAGAKIATFFDQLGQGLGIALAQIETGTNNPDDVLQTARAEIGHINTELKTLSTYGKKAYGVNVGAPDEVIRRLLGLDFSAPVTQKVVDDAIAHLTQVRQNVLKGIAVAKSGKGGTIVAGSKPTPATSVTPPSTGGGGGGGAGTPNPAAAARALAITQQAAAAQQALTAALIAQKAQVDPVTAAWETYSVAEGKANAEAAALIKQNPKQAAAINATRDAQIELARIARDSKLDEIAKKDEAAWQSLLDSLRTPAEVNVDTALAQLSLLNKRLAEGKISAAEYHDIVGKIAAKSVTAAPQYQGLDAAVGGIGSELTKNFQAQAKLDEWHQQALAANEAFRAKDAANEEAYQARLADIDAQYAQQRNQIEQARGQLALQTASGIFGQLASLSSSHNRKMAAIGKAAAIAQAVINTYESATAAYASLASIPYIGPALGAAAAAAAIVAGLANVAQIRAQPVGGYSEGGMTPPGGKYQVAGIVHAGEGVLSQDDIAALGGPASFHALRRSLRGYADGGFVSLQHPLANAPSPAAFGLAAPRALPVNAIGGSAANDGAMQQPPPPVHVFAVFDPADLADKVMNSGPGHKVIINVAGDNPRAIQGKWQS